MPITTEDLYIFFTSYNVHLSICFLHLSSGNKMVKQKCNILKVINKKMFSLPVEVLDFWRDAMSLDQTKFWKE